MDNSLLNEKPIKVIIQFNEKPYEHFLRIETVPRQRLCTGR